MPISDPVERGCHETLEKNCKMFYELIGKVLPQKEREGNLVWNDGCERRTEECTSLKKMIAKEGRGDERREEEKNRNEVKTSVKGRRCERREGERVERTG